MMSQTIPVNANSLLPGATLVDSGKDILGHLQATWLKAATRSEIDIAIVQAFIDEARETMRKERPIGIDHLSFSLAFRYENNRVLAYVDPDPAQPQEPVPGPYNVAVGITG